MSHGKLVRYSSKKNIQDFFQKQKEAEKEGKAPDSSKLWEMMATYLENDVPSIQRQISDHVEYTLARNRQNFDKFGAYEATAFAARDRLIEFWNDTNFALYEQNPKQTFYLSIEFLLGRSLQNALFNLEIVDPFTQALKEFGFRLEELYEEEVDAGLGNGGLGRLAACYLDSLATQNYPAWGYGIRYTYGMFRQEIKNGYQAEIPDIWLAKGNPWEFRRVDVKYPVRFYGEAYNNNWTGGEIIIAVANDYPIPGYKTKNVINLRLWSSEPSSDFDLESFNEGNYYKALERRQRAETISSVLYPNDNTPEGKELRLKQQYFFASATLQDIVRRYKNRGNKDFSKFHEKVAIQLNDTHPIVSIPELMRLLMDIEHFSFEEAFNITRKTFAYTNHTVLPEALEKWPVPLFERLLPRHLQIIYEINLKFLNEELKPKYPDDLNILRRLSIIEESYPKMVRMAYLGIIMSHTVNGVAAIHSQILKDSLFNEFHKIYPNKFTNVTNGITPRRWLAACNPLLHSIISEKIGGDTYLNSLEMLETLKKHADDKKFQVRWMEIKHANKVRLSGYLKKHCNLEVDPNWLFDIQIKRIHEYKRQLMNILRVIYEYSVLKEKIAKKQTNDITPKLVLFAGKSAPGYYKAKLIIKLINEVAHKVNLDKNINQFLKVIFVPNYNVSLAEIIIPASDLSQHISTAGTEASGTSNMKFALNGGLIIGTLDGANIEIRERIGTDNMFCFGLTADQIGPTRQKNTTIHIIKDPRLQRAIDCIRSGDFGDPNLYNDIVDPLMASRDFYLLGDDFGPYLEALDKVEKSFKDRTKWAKMSILSTAGMGYFTSDRSVKEYADKIWKIIPHRPDTIKAPTKEVHPKK